MLSLLGLLWQSLLQPPPPPLLALGVQPELEQQLGWACWS